MEISLFSAVLNVTILLTILSVVVIWLLPQRFCYRLGMAVSALVALMTGYLAVVALTGNEIILQADFGNFIGMIPLKIDGLSAWFILVVDITFLTGVIFGSGYLRGYPVSAVRERFHVTLLLIFHLSMLLVCMVQQGLAFLVEWEIMSLSSTLLILFDHENPGTLKAALNYFVQMHIGVTLLTMGFIWVYAVTGDLAFDAIGTFFRSGNNLWLFLLFFAGFGIKAGFIPFHSWLPHAHPAAPAHVSGIMSGVIVKLGLYGIFRMITFLHDDYTLLGEIILTISVLTGLYGILNAAVHRDFKRMLAYCTIENIGVAGMGAGIGLIGIGSGNPAMYILGFGGALFHILNHSLFKSMLFYSAGSIYSRVHTRNMENLGGMIRTMPVTAVLFLAGSMAIAGLPPFSGFISELFIYLGMMEGILSGTTSKIMLFVLSVAGLSLVGGLSLMAFSKVFGTIFLGQPRSNLTEKSREVSKIMLAPQFLILALMILLVAMPLLWINPILRILETIRPGLGDTGMLVNLAAFATRVSLYPLLVLVPAGMIWLIRSAVLKKKSVEIDSTWGCGYVAPNNRQQYTGKSYTKPLGKIFNFILIENKTYDELSAGEVFPVKRGYASHYRDFFEHWVIRPISGVPAYVSDLVSFIQNGRVQSYVLYGIVFMLAMFIFTIINLLV